MRLTNRETGDSREATVPREIVALKAQGYAEEKPIRRSQGQAEEKPTRKAAKKAAAKSEK